MSACNAGLLTINGLPTDIVIGVADSFWSRFIGLMGGSAHGNRHGLLLRPCASVHTVGMRYAIDVVFLAADGSVLKVSYGVRPMRVVRCPSARTVIELETGLGARLALTPGDVVQTVPVCHNTG